MPSFNPEEIASIKRIFCVLFEVLDKMKQKTEKHFSKVEIIIKNEISKETNLRIPQEAELRDI